MTNITSQQERVLMTLLRQKRVNPQRFTNLLSSGILADVFSANLDERSLEFGIDGARNVIRRVLELETLPKDIEVHYEKRSFDNYREGYFGDTAMRVSKDFSKSCYHEGEGDKSIFLRFEVQTVNIESVDSSTVGWFSNTVDCVKRTLARRGFRPATFHELNWYCSYMPFATPTLTYAFGSFDVSNHNVPHTLVGFLHHSICEGFPDGVEVIDVLAVRTL
jgi:hypothetical protein